LLEVADLASLRARIYVSEYDMYKVRQGAGAKLQVEGIPRIWESQALSITPLSLESDPSVSGETKFKGLHPPQFYVVELPFNNHSGMLKPGMTGFGRIYGKRTSLAGLGWEALRVVLGRKIW